MVIKDYSPCIGNGIHNVRHPSSMFGWAIDHMNVVCIVHRSPNEWSSSNGLMLMCVCVCVVCIALFIWDARWFKQAVNNNEMVQPLSIVVNDGLTNTRLTDSIRRGQLYIDSNNEECNWIAARSNAMMSRGWSGTFWLMTMGQQMSLPPPSPPIE